MTLTLTQAILEIENISEYISNHFLLFRPQVKQAIQNL